MAETTKKGNAPETRTVKGTYAGYTCVCIVKDWGDSESIDIEVKVGKQSVFKVYDCRIVDAENGKFLSFLSRKGSDGNYYNRARITDSDMCEAIIAAIEE